MDGNIYAELAGRFRNEMKQSCAALVGIVQGILSDGELNDREVRFLNDWLGNNENLRQTFPGNILFDQISGVLVDGVIAPAKREHLQQTLQLLIGGTLEEIATLQPVCELALDRPATVDIPEHSFCFTGTFVFGPRGVCEQAVQVRGGHAQPNVTKTLHYLVIGGLGSVEWKHGSFGTKVEKAVAWRAAGIGIRLVHEDTWANSLCLYQPQPQPPASWPFPKDAH